MFADGHNIHPPPLKTPPPPLFLSTCSVKVATITIYSQVYLNIPRQASFRKNFRINAWVAFFFLLWTEKFTWNESNIFTKCQKQGQFFIYKEKQCVYINAQLFHKGTET